MAFNKRFMAGLAAVAVLGVALSGCGGDTADGGSGGGDASGEPIEITLPTFIEKEIVETEPGVRGDTATNVTKPAKIDNGYEIQVPLFINQGDIVKIDTRTGEYAERVSKA